MSFVLAIGLKISLLIISKGGLKNVVVLVQLIASVGMITFVVNRSIVGS